VFADFLTGDPTRAKQELQKHVTKLVLTRKETPDGNVFEVSGDVSLFCWRQRRCSGDQFLGEICPALHLPPIPLSDLCLIPTAEIAMTG
jgi:hypothetical protein